MAGWAERFLRWDLVLEGGGLVELVTPGRPQRWMLLES